MFVRCLQFFMSKIEVTYIGTSCIQATKAPSVCDALQVPQMDQQQQAKELYTYTRNKSFCSLGAIAHPKRRCIYLSALCAVDGRASKIRCGITRENVWLLFIFLPPSALHAFYSELWRVFFCRIHSSRRTWMSVHTIEGMVIAVHVQKCGLVGLEWEAQRWPLC
jgi:hypothetical protein